MSALTKIVNDALWRSGHRAALMDYFHAQVFGITKPLVGAASNPHGLDPSYVQGARYAEDHIYYVLRREHDADPDAFVKKWSDWGICDSYASATAYNEWERLENLAEYVRDCEAEAEADEREADRLDSFRRFEALP